MIEISDLDYSKYVDIVGTAHFTRRSIREAYAAVNSRKPQIIALELDLARFRQLNAACNGCSSHVSCQGLCEFTSAADALGNVDADIWLIDMAEPEMQHRFSRWMGASTRKRMVNAEGFGSRMVHDPVWLWELGYKEKVINYSEQQMNALRKTFPAIPRVLIDERNALMAARLAWIVSRSIAKNEQHILAFIGAAHVGGITELLCHPRLLPERFRRFDLSFSEPTLIRRIAVQAA